MEPIFTDKQLREDLISLMKIVQEQTKKDTEIQLLKDKTEGTRILKCHAL